MITSSTSPTLMTYSSKFSAISMIISYLDILVRIKLLTSSVASTLGLDSVNYWKSCTTCMWVKPQWNKHYGLLKQLLIPENPWNSISMDFSPSKAFSSQQHSIACPRSLHSPMYSVQSPRTLRTVLGLFFGWSTSQFWKSESKFSPRTARVLGQSPWTKFRQSQVSLTSLFYYY